MQIASNRRFWPFHVTTWKDRMTKDADHLLAKFGADAYSVAADRSWREDVGLLKSHDSGHWSRVTLEIGRRLAISEFQFPAWIGPRSSIEWKN